MRTTRFTLSSLSRACRVLTMVLLAAAAVCAIGQGTSASLTGAVTDPTGAALPGATITATNIDTNFTQTVKSNAIGLYLLKPLPIGKYTLSISASGFDVYQQKGIVLTVDLAATQDVHLKIGFRQGRDSLCQC